MVASSSRDLDGRFLCLRDLVRYPTKVPVGCTTFWRCCREAWLWLAAAESFTSPSWFQSRKAEAWLLPLRCQLVRFCWLSSTVPRSCFFLGTIPMRLLRLLCVAWSMLSLLDRFRSFPMLRGARPGRLCIKWFWPDVTRKCERAGMGGANAGDDDLSSEAGSEALPFALTGNRRLPLRMNGRGVSKGPSLLHHISTA